MKYTQSKRERLAVAVLSSFTFVLMLAAVVLTWNRQETASMRMFLSAALILDGVACGIYWNRFFGYHKK